MGHIDFYIMEKAALELVREANVLLSVQKQTEQLLDEGRHAYMSGQMQNGESGGQSFDQAPAAARLRDAADVLETEAESLRRAADCLHKIMLLYRHAQNRVVDTIQGEYSIVPRTVFGDSRFDNLRSFENLIPVSAGKIPKDGGPEIHGSDVPPFNHADLKGIL